MHETSQPPGLEEAPTCGVVEALRWVYLGRRSGLLEVRNGIAQIRKLSFVDGELFLPQTGVDPALVAAMQEDGEPAAASEALKALMQRIAARIVRWSADSYRFWPDEPGTHGKLVGPFPTAQLLMEAAGRYRDEAELVRRLGGPDSQLRAESALPSHAPVGELSTEAWTLLLDCLEKPFALRELMLKPPAERQRWLHVLYRLWVVGLVARLDRAPLAAEAEKHRDRLPDAASLAVEPTIWQAYFGLEADPFALTHDPAFLYLSERHAEALAGLKLGLLERRGLAVLIGEVGTGKTTLIYALLSALDPRVEVAYLTNSSLSFEELLESALRELGVAVWGHRRIDLLDALNSYLRQGAREDAIVAIIIDEAQNLSDATFEQLRLLLNVETYTRKLLQIVLVGQPELGDKLRDPRMRQVRDRIAVRCELGPLARQEVETYIERRIEAVGGAVERFFTRPALALLAKEAKGIPRRINILAHNALLFAYGRDAHRVSKPLMAAAVAEMRGTRH